MSDTHECPSVEQLKLLADGRLSDPPASEFEVHLLECESCAHQTAEMQKGDTFVAAIKQVGRAPIQRSPEEQARLEELMNSLSGLRVEQIDATHLSGPNTLEPPIAIPVVDEVTQELKSVWRPAETDDEIGRMGAYRIQRVLGAGGMGAVFLAVDSQLHRKVALKMMRPRAAAAPGAADRFLREARAAAALRHDHILTIYQVGEEAGVPYLAMEYLEGESLEDRLKRESPLPIADALRIGREIAEGLTAAHAKGLIHRDIKPANVWLEQNANSTHPRVKLLDFGLARSTEDDLQLTSTGMVIGTPSYMSPEQASGEDLDGRADLFSLGVILYRMTTGQLPFPGKKPIEVLKSLATLNPTAPHTLCDVVPPELSNLVMKLLAKDRDERPVTASEVAKTLSEMAGRGPAIPTQPASSMSELPAPHENPIGVRRRNLNGWLIAAAGCAAFALLSVIVITLKDENGNVTEITVNAPKGTKVVDVKQSVDEKLARTNKPEIPQAAQSPSNPAPVTVNQSVISQRKVSVPLSETCLVTNPAPLPGVESWSIETLQPRGWTDDPVFDPTGRWMAILNFEGVVRILDAQSGRVARMLVGHEGQVASAAWSLDGKWIVTSGRDQTIKLWEFDSGKLIQTYPQSGTAYSMAFSDDGKWLAGCISGTKPTICIWEAVTGKFVRSLDVATDSSRHRLAWLPGKSTLSTVNLQTGGLEFVEASLDAVIRSEKLQSASQTWAELFEAKWSHDRSRIAGVLSGNRIAIWDALGGTLIKLTEPIPGRLESLGSFGEQQFVAYALANELRIEMINVESLEVVAGIDFDRVIKGPVASPDAKHLYLRGNPRLTDHFLVDLATKKQVWEQRWLNDEDGRYIAWHPDGRRLLTGYHARIWDLAARKLKRVPGNNDAAGSLSWSPDGNILATSEGDRVAFYDATTWKRLRETSALPHAMDFAWSPDGEEIAVVSNNDSEGIIRIYDVATAKMNAGIKLQHAPHHSILWNPNGTLLPYGGGAEFYHAKSGELIRRLDWAAMCTASWSPFGKTLAAGFDGARSGGPGVFLFEGITDQAWQIPGTTRLNDYKRSFAWSPDERFLAAVEWDHRVRVFEVNSGEVIASLSGRDIVGDGGLAWKDRSVAWSPDGSTLSVQFKDGKTRLWDTTTWQPIGTLVPLDGEQSLIVGPDGHFVGTQRAKFQIAYIVQTGGRQLFLTADEFAREFDWKNTEDKALATATPYRHSAPLDPSKNSQLIESVNTSAGEPLNAFSLVGRPARIEGVKSWTVDTVGHRHPIVDFKESPNGKWLSSMDRNGGVRLWDTARAQLVKILPTLPGSEAKLAWSPDERQLAIVLNSGAIQVWNVEQGQVVREGESQNKSSVQTAKWSHDGKTLLVCHEDELLLWDTNSWMIKDRSNQVGVFASWSADEKQIASLDAKTGVPLILDANSFEMTVKAEVPRGIPVSWPRGFAWSPVGQRIAVLGSKDLNLWLLDATSGQVIWSQSDLSLQGYPFNPAWSPDGSLLAVLLGAENGSEIMILDGRNGEILSRSIINQFQGGFAPSPAWSSDGRTISIAYPDGTIRFWDVETRKVRLTVDGNRQGRNVSLSTFKANGYLVVDFHYLHTFWDFAKLELVHVGQYSLLRRSPDGITGTSHLCDVFSQKTMGSPIVEAIPLSPPPERSHGQWDSAWSGDGKLFAITNYQRHCVYLYEHATGKLLREFKVVGNEYLESVAIAPDGKTIACGMAYFVALHRADDGELLKTSKGEATRFVSLAYSPDGALLALGRSDGKVQICKSDLSEIVKEFPAHTTSVASFHWTADGRLITGGALGDNTVHIWNPHTGERQGSLAPHRDSQYLSVSSQGHYRAVPRGLFREIRYVVQLEDGSHITLTPAEFEERFGWKNESELVKLPAMK